MVLMGAVYPATGQVGLLDATPEMEAPLVTLEVVASRLQSPAGEPIELVGTIRVAEGWVFYSAAPGDGPLPARVTIPDANVNQEDMLWSAHEAHPTDVGGGVIETYYVYEDEGQFSVTVRMTPNSNHQTQLLVSFRGQVCSDETQQCVPINEVHIITIPTKEKKRPG